MRELSRVVVEAVVVVGLGCGVGLTVNGMRPRNGIDLGRDYWSQPASSRPTTRITTPITTPAVDNQHLPTPPDPDDPMAKIIQALHQQNLQEIRHKEVVESFNNPLYAAGGIVFIDARSDDHFAAGHIPGAHHLYRFWNEAELDRVIQRLEPILQSTEKIVVYCQGGECEDSAAMAAYLIQRGIDARKVFVDIDGFEAWTAAGLKADVGEGEK